MLRILSLLPSTTEIVGELGLADYLVGRSHECDRPPEVLGLPIVTQPKLDLEAPSRAIDDRVRALVRDGLSVYRVFAERVRELAPDVILTQTQCEVCAVTPGDLEEALRTWTAGRPALIAVEPATLAQVLEDFARVGAGCGVPELGAALRDREAERLESQRRACRAVSRGPRVACLEWIDPVMGCGNWIPELVESAGGVSILGCAGAHAQWSSLEELARLDPDWIIIAPCGFDLARTRAELPALTRHPLWSELRCVREGRAALVDGWLHVNRPGPRIAESLEILAEILHPPHFAFGHRGRAWEPLAAGPEARGDGASGTGFERRKHDG